jgi:hypothetical protein
MHEPGRKCKFRVAFAVVTGCNLYQEVKATDSNSRSSSDAIERANKRRLLLLLVIISVSFEVHALWWSFLSASGAVHSYRAID